MTAQTWRRRENCTRFTRCSYFFLSGFSLYAQNCKSIADTNDFYNKKLNQRKRDNQHMLWTAGETQRALYAVRKDIPSEPGCCSRDPPWEERHKHWTEELNTCRQRQNNCSNEHNKDTLLNFFVVMNDTVSQCWARYSKNVFFYCKK